MVTTKAKDSQAAKAAQPAQTSTLEKAWAVLRDAAQVQAIKAELASREEQVLGARLPHDLEHNVRSVLLEQTLYGVGWRREASPELMMLEFLHVLSCQGKTDPLSLDLANAQGRTYYLRRRQLRLRRILFNNHFLNLVESKTALSDEQQWQLWERYIIEGNSFKQKLKGKARQQGKGRHATALPAATAAAVAAAGGVGAGGAGAGGASAAVVGTELSAGAKAAVEAVTSGDNVIAQEELMVVGDAGSEVILTITHDDVVELREHFGSFKNFCKVVNLLRSWAINYDSDRSWASKFLFPFGIDALFWELESKSSYFVGVGQLLYTMLQRSSHAHELGPQLYQAFFSRHDPLNQLTTKLERSQVIGALHERLSAMQSMSLEQKAGCNDLQLTRYLPYAHHAVYERLARDIDNILALDLTKQELFYALSSICMLNLMVFVLEQSASILRLCGDDNCDINMVVVINPERATNFKKLSAVRYRDNDAIVALSLKRYAVMHVKAFLEAVAPFLLSKKSLTTKEAEFVGAVMRELFSFNDNLRFDLTDGIVVNSDSDAVDSDDDDEAYAKVRAKSSAAAAAGSGAAAAVDDGATKSTYARGSGGSGVSGGSGGSSGRGKYSLDGLLEHLTDFIEERDNHLNDLLSYYARRIGLSNGATARTPCYTLSDDLLRHLVLATLDKNEPFLMLSEFLERVYERYHLVIGPIEGRLYYQERSSKSAEYTDEIEFTKNHRALRAKLERLGLLIPLSDSCDYIKNPYATGNSH